MDYMDSKTFLDGHRRDRAPSFDLIPYATGYITERIQTRAKSCSIILIASESVLFVQLTPVNYSDRSGHFPILLGMILIGAAVGALSYTASEVVSYGLTGEWSWSWGQFAGSLIGGAVGGALMASGAGAFVVGFGSGFVSTATGMSLQNAFEGTNYSADRILGLSLISGFASGAIAMLPSIGISGITTGRNSFGAITASITKKYVNGTIRNMALKTMGKMFTYNLVTSAFDVAWGGFTDATGFDDSAYDYSQLIYGWLHI